MNPRAQSPSGKRTSAADIGVWGLGTMGGSLALNFAEHGFTVALHNRSPEKTLALVAENRERPWGARLVAANDPRRLVEALASPRRVLLMVPAGPPVDQCLAELTELLAPGDVIVDGGNSLYTDTERRAREAAALKLHFVGCGVSGGEEGARHGPSLMPGGDPAAYALLQELLSAIAADGEDGKCVTWVGPGGAGHFVKMVHNGIEYADMQLLAEAYDLLRRGVGLEAPAIAEVFADWNRGPLESFLLELAAQVARRKDEATGLPLLDQVADVGSQKGTGRWTVQTALEHGVAVPTLTAAVDARTLSADEGARRSAASRLPGPDPDQDRGWLTAALGGRERALAAIHDGLHASRYVAFAQGMELVRVAGDAHGWGIDRAELARIWTAGCILRARMLSVVRAAFSRDKASSNLALDPAVTGVLRSADSGWRALLAAGLPRGLPLPALSASLAWYDTLRARRLPINLTQAQRDAFGAHGYRRRDDPAGGPFHSDW